MQNSVNKRTRPAVRVIYPHADISLDADASMTNHGGDAIIIEQELPGFGLSWGIHNGDGISYFPVEANPDGPGQDYYPNGPWDSYYYGSENLGGPWQAYYQGPESEVLVPLWLDDERDWFGDSGWLACRVHLLRIAIAQYLKGYGLDEMRAVSERLSEVLKNPGYHRVIQTAASEAALKSSM